MAYVAALRKAVLAFPTALRGIRSGGGLIDGFRASHSKGLTEIADLGSKQTNVLSMIVDNFDMGKNFYLYVFFGVESRAE